MLFRSRSGFVTARLEIPAGLEGERVDRVVSIVTGLSRARSADLVSLGSVQLGDKVVSTRSERVSEGQVLLVDWEAPPPAAALAADSEVAFTVVHVDDAVIVIDKPTGLVVHPGSGVSSGTLVHGLLARFPELALVGEAHRPGIVHRLDKGTSGLMVVARTEAAYLALVGQLAEHSVERRYRALVCGRVAASGGLIDAPLGRSPRDPIRRGVVANGKPARTNYRVDALFWHPMEASLLTCNLETGRTHQIRVHLKVIGHPVVGDDVYGGRRAASVLPRPWLHAEGLTFAHPVTGQSMAFNAALPPDLQVVLDRFS